MTIKQLLNQGSKLLQQAQIETAKLDSSLLLAHILHVSKEYIIARDSDAVNKKTEKLFHTLLQRRSQGEPLAYITGEKEFFGLPFFVSPNVLIPRAETEQLVEEGIKVSKKLPLENTVFIDVGTGSGAIAVSLAYSVPRAKVIALDISNKALQTACKNMKRHFLTNITLLKSDLLENIPKIQSQNVVLLVNLPYVRNDEIQTLPKQVRSFEPHTALRGGEDGLILYRKLFSEVALKLQGKKVFIIFECDPLQIKKIKKMIRFSFCDPIIHIFKDLSGKERGGVVRCEVGREKEN